jgi:hypothetical protein
VDEDEMVQADEDEQMKLGLEVRVKMFRMGNEDLW